MKKGKEKLQNSITLKLTDTEKINIFLIYSSDSADLQNFFEIQSGNVNCYVNLTWNGSRTIW